MNPNNIGKKRKRKERWKPKRLCLTHIDSRFAFIILKLNFVTSPNADIRTEAIKENKSISNRKQSYQSAITVSDPKTTNFSRISTSNSIYLRSNASTSCVLPSVRKKETAIQT